MQNKFYDYLSKKYKQLSANNSLSTCSDYCYRVSVVCRREGITMEQLAENIAQYVKAYSVTGEKADIGKRSHSSYYAALKQFEKFVLLQRFAQNG